MATRKLTREELKAVGTPEAQIAKILELQSETKPRLFKFTFKATDKRMAELVKTNPDLTIARAYANRKERVKAAKAAKV